MLTNNTSMLTYDTYQAVFSDWSLVSSSVLIGHSHDTYDTNDTYSP